MRRKRHRLLMLTLPPTLSPSILSRPTAYILYMYVYVHFDETNPITSIELNEKQKSVHFPHFVYTCLQSEDNIRHKTILMTTIVANGKRNTTKKMV